MDKNPIQAMIDAGKELKFDKITMRELEALNVPAVEHLTPAQIKSIREKAKLSQGVMAYYLNVKPSTLQKWEQGHSHPAGAAMKLLNLAYRHGMNFIAA
jgi:putative transcriptional regulator